MKLDKQELIDEKIEQDYLDDLTSMEKAEIAQLRNSIEYKRASDTKKIQMEKSIQSKFEASRKKEEEATNAKLKKEFKKQQLVKVANVIMNTADGISKAVALNPSPSAVINLKY